MEAPQSVHHYKRCVCIYQGALLSTVLRYLNKAVSLQIYKKCNLQHASAKLATCATHIEGHWVGPRVLLHALHHYSLRVKIILADFNLEVSTPTTKPLAIQYLANTPS